MKKEIQTIALLQFQTTSNYQENLEKLVSYILAHQDKALIMAPEVYLTGYDYDNFDASIAFYKIAMQRLLPLISTQILVFTIVKKEGNKILNQAVVIHNHQIVYTQNKYKLFKLGDEHEYFEAGEIEEIEHFTIEGVRYALIICFELRFKELWKRLEGVDVILVPSMWGKPRKNHLEILSQALAIMNQCYVLVCNSANEDMACSSAVIHPWGEVIMDDKLEIIEDTLHLRNVTKVRRLVPMR